MAFIVIFGAYLYTLLNHSPMSGTKNMANNEKKHFLMLYVAFIA